MDIIFHIEYYTTNGEQLVLNIIDRRGHDHGRGDISHDHRGDSNDGRENSNDGRGNSSDHRYTSRSRHLMNTTDNAHWHFCWHTAGRDSDTVDYYFTVEKAGLTLRREWTTVCHRLDLPTRDLPSVNIHCRWTDVPHDTYRYSSAFTDCLHPHPIRELHSPGHRCTRLVCRAPQLRSSQRLVLTGSDRALGDWDPARGIPMTEHNYNEWVAEIATDLLCNRRIEFKFVLVNDDGRSAPVWEDGQNRRLHLESSEGLTVYELDQSFYPLCDERVAGTLIPVFSLRTEGSFGVGDLGDLTAMTDFIASTGQRVLQILPVNDTTVTHTWTDSYPYSCISVFALHPQYTDLRQLPPLNDSRRRNHYEQLRRELNALPHIDYERMIKAKTDYLEELYRQEGQRTMQGDGFETFFDDNCQWLVPYARYCSLRDKYHTTDFNLWHGHETWDEAEREALSDKCSSRYREVAFYYFCQFILHNQMTAAHRHARSRGVILKGDIPIGVHRQGCDVWTEPRYFNLDSQAGAPPDDFATDGQNWGFPTYNWQAMQADGYGWWYRRFTHMARYFDAYRIDHVLGFFRIWEIPVSAVRGLLGQFAPALALTRDEIESYGFHPDEHMLHPYITDDVLDAIFGEKSGYVRINCLTDKGDGTYALRPEYATERKIQLLADEGRLDDHLCDGLYQLTAEVLLLADHRNPQTMHPRISARHTHAYRRLSESQRQAYDHLYDDFYYRRNNAYWYGEAMKKLPPLIEATRMLTCAEDLGMVPDCVAPVMEQLRILSLEIQTMPKTAVRFAHPGHNPYRSVCTFSSHDMAPLRQWWDEDYARAQDYYCSMLGHEGTAPHPMPVQLAREVIDRHLFSPSMLCILSLQDWLAMSERLRLPDPNGERINVPANPHHYWRYRMHLNISEMAADKQFCRQLTEMIDHSGRRLP